jgi:hypothetical protein
MEGETYATACSCALLILRPAADAAAAYLARHAAAPALQPKPQVSAPAAAVVYVSGLPWWARDSELETLLAEYGKITSLRIQFEAASGKSTGVAQVTFQEETQAAACAAAVELSLQGKPLSTSRASPTAVRAPALAATAQPAAPAPSVIAAVTARPDNRPAPGGPPASAQAPPASWPGHRRVPPPGWSRGGREPWAGGPPMEQWGAPPGYQPWGGYGGYAAWGPPSGQVTYGDYGSKQLHDDTQRERRGRDKEGKHEKLKSKKSRKSRSRSRSKSRRRSRSRS